MERRKTRQISVGTVKIGGGAPVSVQSMTKTDTADVEATLAQVERCAAAGCQIIRVAVPDAAAAQALQRIVEGSPLPVVGDVHFLPELAVRSVEAGAACVRVNPGNMPLEGVRAVVDAARSAGVPIRIGLNSGSVRRRGEKVRDEFELADLMVERALEYARDFEGRGFGDIKLSLKASSAAATIHAYRKAADLCDYPFHLGVTATGPRRFAVVKSAVGIGSLLAEGIGDTIRVSLTAEPQEEVEVGKEILAGLELKSLPFEVIACPTCARTKGDVAGMADEVDRWLRELGGHGGRTVKVAVMGCEVNGPGEAADADVGAAFGKGAALLFIRGEKVRKLEPREVVETLVEEARRIAGI